MSGASNYISHKRLHDGSQIPQFLSVADQRGPSILNIHIYSCLSKFALWLLEFVPASSRDLWQMRAMSWQGSYCCTPTSHPWMGRLRRYSAISTRSGGPERVTILLVSGSSFSFLAFGILRRYLFPAPLPQKSRCRFPEPNCTLTPS